MRKESAAALFAASVVVGALGTLAVSSITDSQSSVSGTLRVAVAMGGTVQQVQAEVVGISGDVTPLHITADDTAALQANAAEPVKVTGDLHDGTLDVSSIVPTAAKAAPTAAAPANMNVALVLIQAAGTTNPYTLADAQAALDKSVAFWRSTSGGQMTVNARVFGPYTSTLSPGDCSISDWVNAGATAATAQGYSPTTFSDIVTMANLALGFGGCWSGIGYVGSPGAVVATKNAVTIEHEVGHNLGMWHSGAVFGGRLPEIDYADETDVMGTGSDPSYQGRPYGAAHKATIGWLPQSEIATVASGTQTLALTANEDPVCVAPCVELVRVGAYDIERRLPVGLDTGMLGGVYVHSHVFTGTSDEWIPDMPTRQTAAGQGGGPLYVGETFSDASGTLLGGQPMSVKVLANDPAAATASVQVCVGTCGTPPSTSTTTTSIAPTSTSTTVGPTTTTTVTPGKQGAPALTATVLADGTVRVSWTQPITIARTAIQLVRGPSPTHVNGIGTFYNGQLAQGFYIDTRAPAGVSYYLARFTTAGTATAWSVPVSITR